MLYTNLVELAQQQIEQFREELAGYYAHYARHTLPWRQTEADGSFDPYKIMVSELMLQQTQVTRVIPKFQAFLVKFPDVHVLAQAELGDVLREWQGLGYNRRAKFLWQSAVVVDKLNHFPDTLEVLITLPGIGTNTAGAIMAYAFNSPAIFIETNVRTVYIHHFFADQTDVNDTYIKQLVQQTLDQEDPRDFYWALMDYGSHLKATKGNLNKISKHYTKQSKFHGSRRQVRGEVIRLLGKRSYANDELHTKISDNRLPAVLEELVSEQLIRQNGSVYSL